MNKLKYVLLTVTGTNNIIIKYDWLIDNGNYFRDTESIIDNSAISITTYSQEEQEDFFGVKNILDKSSVVKWVDILDSILYERRLYYAGNQE